MTNGGQRAYKITSLFDVRKPKSITAKSVTPDSGDTPYVTAQAGNNGVQTLIECPADWMEEGGCILIGGKTMTFSYHPKPFCSNDSHNIALYPSDGMPPWSEEVFLYLLTTLRASLKRKYTWSDSISSKSLKKETVTLPALPDGAPDWEHMRTVMRGTLDRADGVISTLLKVSSARTIVNSTGWRPFRIEDLFVVQKGTRLTRANMIPGDIPFIGATLENNGITAHIGNREHIHPGGALTVAYNGQKAMGKAFWQPKPFWASDDINVLYPKFELNEQIALFLQPIFWEASHAFSYDDKWNKAAMERTTLTLPVKADGSPDWEYMQHFMQQAIDDADEAISQLEEL